MRAEDLAGAIDSLVEYKPVINAAIPPVVETLAEMFNTALIHIAAQSEVFDNLAEIRYKYYMALQQAGFNRENALAVLCNDIALFKKSLKSAK